MTSETLEAVKTVTWIVGKLLACIEAIIRIAKPIRRLWDALRGKKRRSEGRHPRKTRRRKARSRHRNRSGSP